MAWTCKILLFLKNFISWFFLKEWTDYKLAWNPSQYGDIDVVEIPSSDIWVPDIVLYNNADGTYEVNTITKAHVVRRIIFLLNLLVFFLNKLLSIGMEQ